MRSKRMQPAAVPPAAAIRPAVLRRFPPIPFWTLPVAATVVRVSVAVPVPPAVSATLAGEIVPFMLSEVAEVGVKLAVPVYPPVEVSVMVEVPVFPGEGDEMVTLVAESVILGLLTVAVVVPFDVAL
jgi:hypothetical protein